MRRAAVVSAIASVALLVALALAGGQRGHALYAYVLFIGALGLLVLTARARSAVRTPPLEQLIPRRAEPERGVKQLESLARELAGGRSNAFELHHRLRPLVRQIAAARLARRHGVDLEQSPESARALLGPRVWELARPGREPPAERFLPGWSPAELQELVDELEAI